MQKMLEFHDASVECIQCDAEGVTVRFSSVFAYSSWNASNVDLDSSRYYPAEICVEAGTVLADCRIWARTTHFGGAGFVSMAGQNKATFLFRQI